MIWTSPLIGFVKLSDKFTTGSSIMPQKRNPDAAELVRAKTGRIIGALTALLIVMKGLPLAYAKDMQEDKEGALDALAALVAVDRRDDRHGGRHEPDAARMKKAAGEGYATATDLADWLVRSLKMPFREAHHITGRIVAKAAEADLAAAPAAARRHARDRAANQRGCVRRAVGRALGAEPHQLRRHRAQECARAGEEMAAKLEKEKPDFYPAVSPCLPDLLWCLRTKERAREPFLATACFSVSPLIGVLAASLGLAACGRKGPLDLPPGASLAGEPQAQYRRTDEQTAGAPIGGQAQSGTMRASVPTVSRWRRKGPNKRIPLDVLAATERVDAPLRLSRRRPARRGGESRHARGRGRDAVLLLFDRDAGAALPGVRRRLRRCATRWSATP